MVGAITCKYEEDEDNKESRVVYIMTITVLKAYRRYGIGSQLLEQAIDDCKKEDVKRIYLHVLESNKSALEFYHKHGFTIKETLLNYYEDLEEPNCLVLEKVF